MRLYSFRVMADSHNAEQLAANAADTVRRVIAEAEERAGQIVREAQSEAVAIRKRADADAAQIRERAEADARAQIEAAKRALDELGGSLAMAASGAVERAESEPAEPEPEPAPEPETEEEPESPGAPEAPVSPPAEKSPTVESAPAAGNGDDAAERLVAMKLAVEGKDSAAIEAQLIDRFGPRDRSALLRDVLSRAAG
jgi:hypothetical protein